MKEPIIRAATKQDLTEIVYLCGLHSAYEKAAYNPTDKAKDLDKHLFGEQPAAHCLVVEYDGHIVGYATYMKQFSTWDAAFYIYMDCLFLTEGSRGKGIGVQLVDALKAAGKKMNCDLIQWQTPDFNTRAIKFYHRIGATSKNKERFFLTISE